MTAFTAFTALVWSLSEDGGDHEETFMGDSACTDALNYVRSFGTPYPREHDDDVIDRGYVRGGRRVSHEYTITMQLCIEPNFAVTVSDDGDRSHTRLCTTLPEALEYARSQPVNRQCTVEGLTE